MPWLLSILIGLLTAVVGCFSVGFLATLNVRWYRISSFEGGSGYYVVFLGLAGIIAGFIVGVVSSRIVATWPDANFLKGLGVACGSMVALVFVIGVICRLGADIAPKIDGKPLELAVEIMCPTGADLPVAGTNPPYVAVSLFSRNRRGQPSGELQPENAKQVDGRWVVPATVPLRTSAQRKLLHVVFNDATNHMFGLPLRAHPKTENFDWSSWQEAGWTPGTERPTPENNFLMRFRVQVIEPPPPGPTYAEIQAQEVAAEQATFDAIPADAPVATWLEYTKYGTAPERLALAIENITGREDFVSELRPLMLGDENQIAADALRCVEHLTIFPPELHEAVREAGLKIITMLRTFNATKPEDDPSYQGAADISVRFSAWRVAVATLRKQSDGDFTPELQEILTLARVRDDSICLRGDVVRVASYYLKEWAGVEPVAGDPPPR